MSENTTTHAPRRYCEYNNGRICRKYLTRTRDDPQHHIRTDRIGSRNDAWSQKDATDLQCSTLRTKESIRDREDQLWETNPRNRKGINPLANVVGWYSGHIDTKAWTERKVRCHRRILPASESRMKRRNSKQHAAYLAVKAEREAEEGPATSILTSHEQGILKALQNDVAFEGIRKAKEVEAQAAQRKLQQEEELKKILASFAPAAAAPYVLENSQATTPPGTPLQMHPDRFARVGTARKSASAQVVTEEELRRQRELKLRRGRARLEGRLLDEDSEEYDSRGEWQAPDFEFV